MVLNFSISRCIALLTSWSYYCSATCVCRLCLTETTYMLKSPIVPCCLAVRPAALLMAFQGHEQLTE